MHYLSLGAVFRHENNWLDEWITYHAAVGVEHFYLYNHDDDSRVSDRILLPYVRSGLVENIHIKDNDRILSHQRSLQQVAAIQEMIREKSGEMVWLGLIDLDEFLLPRRCDDLRELLPDYEEYAALVMSWSHFGSSGYIKRPPTQINHLLRRADNDFRMNRFVKSIVRPERIDVGKIMDNVHICTPHKFVSEEYPSVDEHHRVTDGTFYNEYTDDIVRVNHYAVRSYQDFWDVKVPRGRFTTPVPRNEKFWKEHDRNETRDDEISVRFGRHVKEGERSCEAT